MLLLKTPLSRTTVASIALAFAGVIVISFAGSGGQTEDGVGPRNRGLGDLIMMLGKCFVLETDVWADFAD